MNGLSKIRLLTRQSAGYLVFCLVGILLFLAAGILPARSRQQRLMAEIRQLEAKLEVQRELRPEYERIRQDKAMGMQPEYPMPVLEPLPQASISSIPMLFSEMTRGAGLEFVSAHPLRQSMSEDLGRLRVVLTCRGAWLDFRTLLIALGGTSFVVAVDRVEAMVTEGPLLDYVLQVDVALPERVGDGP